MNQISVPLGRLRLRLQLPKDVQSELTQVGKSKREGHCTLAHTRLTPRLTDPRPWVAAAAGLERIRIAAAQAGGRCDGPSQTWDDVGRLSRRFAQRASEHGLPEIAAERYLAAAYFFSTGLNYADALAAVADARAASSRPRWRAMADRYGGFVERQLNRSRRSEELLQRSIRGFQSVGENQRLRLAHQNLANTLVNEGRFVPALEALLDSAPTPDASNHTQAAFLHNLTWVLLNGHAANALTVPADLIDQLEARAMAIYGEQNMKSWQADASAMRAWNALLHHDLPAARQHLDTRDALVDPRTRDYNSLFAIQLDGTLLLAEHRCADAWARFADVARATSNATLSEPAWQSRQGLARAADCAGEPDAALAYRYSALRLIDRIAAHTEVTAGRGQFFASRRQLVDETLGALLQRSLTHEAWRVANAVQARVVRGLQTNVRVESLPPKTRQQWLAKRTAFEQARQRYQKMLTHCDFQGFADAGCTPAPLEAELRLALDAAYAVLDEAAPLATATGLTVAATRARLGPNEAVLLFAHVGDALGTLWLDADTLEFAPVQGDPLAPWHAKLAHTRAIYVVSGGAPEAARLSAATDAHGLVLAHTQISFLPYLGALAPASARPEGPALVVADPTSDLPQARQEGQLVARALPQATLLTGPEATADALRQALKTAHVFHYAGHGVLQPESPWEAHLRLPDGQRLTLADVVMLGRAPTLVVLDGCDTGRRLALGRYDTVGLPAAFILAGARTVLATLEPIDDGASTAFFERFYRHGGAHAPGRAFQKAALESAALGDDTWQAFYLVGQLQ
jgi:hypothetical protein